MPRYTLLGLLLVLGLVFLSVAGPRPTVSRPQLAESTAPVPGSPPGRPPVRLAVVLVIDQLRGDYVDKWRPFFGKRGFDRLQTHGAWFANCYYPHGTTTTGPGHSIVLSGADLNDTGIINNDWYDRSAAAGVYCAASSRYQLVPPAKPVAVKPGDKPKTPTAGNPDLMLAETVADVLKAQTGGQGKVFGVSLKDRSAILPCGKKPDGVFWFTGQFVTSTYYRDTLPKWVSEFNAAGKAGEWYGQTWDRLRPNLDYDQLSGPDQVVAEADINGQGITFPHPTNGGKPDIGKEYYEALANSPFGNDLLVQFAKACIQAENLGQDDVPDLLVMSFSSNDLVGHTFGPDSHEVLDCTLRTDVQIGQLLDYLDDRVGHGKYSLVITADHGICPMPEVSNRKGIDAKRIDSAKMTADANTFLKSKYGDPAGKAWVEAFSPPWVYLNHANLAAKKLTPNDVAAVLVDWFRTRADVTTAYSLAQLTGPTPSDDPMFSLVQKATHPTRSGDVYVVLKPFYYFSDPVKGKGTTHGAPHDYDRHVPLIVYGPGVGGGRRDEASVPQQAATATAYFLGVNPPKQNKYPLPGTLVK